MIEWKPKLWVGLSAAALTVGLAACGEAGTAATVTAATPSAAAGESAAGENAAGEAATGEGGGEAAAGEAGGEAGAADAYAGVPEGSRKALRIAHLAGFLAIAEKVAATGDGPAASILIQQGLLEVYTPAEADYSGKAALIKPAYEAAIAALDAGKPKAEIDAAFKAARDAQAAASTEAGGDPVAVTKAMLSIATGLYSLVVQPTGVDPIEYQHSMGAALSARDTLVAAEAALRGKNSASFGEAKSAMDALVGLFATPVAPETAPAASAMLAAAARVELPLSDLSK